MISNLQHIHDRYYSSAIPVIAPMLLLVCGCATTATGTWQQPRTTNAPFEKILVIATLSYADMRIDLEQQIAQYVSMGGTANSRAYTSVSIESDLEHAPKTPESVNAMVKKIGADAVLIMRMVDETVQPGESQQKAYVEIGPQVTVIQDANMTEVWASDYTIHETDAMLVANTDTKMEAILYDVADNERIVYKIAAETKYQEEGSDTTYIIADNIAQAVTKRLRRENLIH